MSDRDEFEAWFSDESQSEESLPEDAWVSPDTNPLIPRAWQAARRWRPIEEAPKDGTAIIGARWNDAFGKWEHGVISWYDGTWKVIPTRDLRLSLMATHWMPLPEPPNE